jgi:hypothetical protein
LFLYYCPEVALTIVKDMVEEAQAPRDNGLSNQIDRESKQFAVRLKKCPNFKATKKAFGRQ